MNVLSMSGDGARTEGPFEIGAEVGFIDADAGGEPSSPLSSESSMLIFGVMSTKEDNDGTGDAAFSSPVIFRGSGAWSSIHPWSMAHLPTTLASEGMPKIVAKMVVMPTRAGSKRGLTFFRQNLDDGRPSTAGERQGPTALVGAGSPKITS